MKFIFLFLLSLFFLNQNIYAYNISDVQQHDNVNDCWVIFENKIYDITQYVKSHDRYMDISPWCGLDMTEDFKDKAGSDRDHRPNSYTLLDSYYISDLKIESSIENISNDNQENLGKGINSNEYNLIIPLVISMITYWGIYIFIKRNILNISINKFNGIFNTILLLLLLIPGLIFGIIMILRYKITSIYDISFDFMYWHVELSLLMGFLGINHFLQRFKSYILQLKK